MLRKTLASVFFFASVVFAESTFQTFPGVGNTVRTNGPLTVRWKKSPENPPDSTPAPAMFSVSLGAFSPNGTPKVYYPPLNGPENNVPFDALVFQWKWDPNHFTDGPLAPRGVPGKGSQFFFQIHDGEGYISSGQKFYIDEVDGTPGPSKIPDDAPTPNSNAGNTGVPTSSGNGNGNPAKSNSNSAGSTSGTADAVTPKDNGASGHLSPRLAVAAAAFVACVGGSMI